MFLSNASIRRPIAMSCLLIALVLLGFNTYRKMGLEMLPSIDAPIITIKTIFPGASPEQIETDVAKRIEDKVMTLNGIKHVESTAMENVCFTFLEFEYGTDIDIAAMDVREKIGLIAGDFPAGVEDPIVEKFDVNAVPVVKLALTGDLPIADLYDYADNTLKDRLSSIAGVAECTLIGGAKREVHILIDRDKLAARGLTSGIVAQNINSAIGLIPSGRVKDNGFEYTVEFDADPLEVVDFNELEVANVDGKRVYLKDVGKAVMTTEEIRQKAFLDGASCIAIEIVKLADANAVEVVDSVRSEFSKLKEQLPGGMDLKWVNDEGKFIKASVDSAWENVAMGVVLTGLILFLFLYNIRTTFVVCITMPLTIVIGLFFMGLMNYTLNMSTLISIGMSVGILVTNSIVVMEAISKHISQGKDPKEAARLGASDSWLPVLASAGTNCVVLLPIAMMGGMVAMFLKPLVLTMLIMTLVSLFISFTLTPMLCAKLLTSRKNKGVLAFFENKFNAGLDKVISAYRKLLRLFEKRKIFAILFIIAVVLMFMSALKSAKAVGGSFFPDLDKGSITVRLEFPTSYSLDNSVGRVLEIAKLFDDLPGLTSSLVTVGKIQGIAGQASEGVYLGQVQLKFLERDERDATIYDLLEIVRNRLTGITDCLTGAFIPSLIGGISTPVEAYIVGDELDVLNALSLNIKQYCENYPGFSDVDTSVRLGKNKLKMFPKRAIFSDLGISATTFGMSLRGNLEGIEIGTFKQGDRNYDIVVKYEEIQGKDQVKSFSVPGLPGKPVSVESFVNFEEVNTPVQILRRDKRRVTKLTSNLNPDFPLGIAIGVIASYVDKEQLLPPGYEIIFSGDAENMAESQASLGEAGLLAIILVILTLAAIMESWKQPALILVTLPLGLIGVFWALLLMNESISVFVIMGIVMLIGIVVNNAILIMEQLNVHLREGMPVHKAMITAAGDQMRPIIMITFAGFFGMLPMGLAQGIGAEARNGVGIASAGGILISGILTLFVVPILYDFGTRRGKKKIMKDKISIIIILIGLSLPMTVSNLSAQDSASIPDSFVEKGEVVNGLLTLKQAKEIALSGNPGLQAAMTRIEAASAIAQQAKSAWLPTVSAYGSAYRMEEVPGSQGALGSHDNYKAGVDVSWLLFDGLSRKYRIMAAKYGEEISENSTLDAQRLLLQGVSQAYLAVLFAGEQQRIAIETAKLNEVLYKETRDRNLAGAASRSDVMNFKMRKIASENQALAAELSKRQARIALARLMGVDDGTVTNDVQSVSNLEQEYKEFLVDFDKEILYAVDHRPDLLQKELELDQAEAAVSAEKGSYMPTVVATGRYGYNGVDDTDALNKDENTEAFVGVVASWDLFDGGMRHGKVRATKADASAASDLYRKTQIDVVADVRVASDNLEIQNLSLQKSDEIYRLADEIENVVTEEYNASLVSVTRLNQVQTDAVAAESALARERLSRILAIENLNASTGKILEH
ncbi:MAG: efflux RND transporter permease subunit [Kiritimatiellae bacterium]|jgi:HAE1 family hydrophobic/amphiphilic exporter-1|nr:efflux RND transporter permease subunit [Kiritimatiellia bacterium]